MVNFATGNTISLSVNGKPGKNSTHPTYGLNVHRDLTIGLDFTGIVQLLNIDHRERLKSVYSPGMIRIIRKNYIKTVLITQSLFDRYDFDFVKFLLAHHRLEFK